MRDFVFVDPVDGTPLEKRDTDTLCNPQTGAIYPRVDGIWHLLPPQREGHYAQFVQDYETVRKAEGRGADDPMWYRALPFIDQSGKFSADWRIRAQSYNTLLRRLLIPIENRLRGTRFTIADIGAGNGWLSNRFAERDHHVAAVDLLVNDWDGLGAYRHYMTHFTPVQAEFDHLPFESTQFDLVVFNGALHYATDYAVTLTEALRLLKPEGYLIIMDSPVYHDATSGVQMVAEREAHFEQTYGTRSDSIESEHFLTYDRLDQLSSELDITWRFFQPFYGWKWALRPIRARLRGHREPAQFMVIAGERGTS